MKKNDRLAHLVSVDKSVLESVAGGRYPWDDWDWLLASPSCTNSVRNAADNALYGRGGSWDAMEGAANQAWYGPDCNNYGWW